MSGEVAVEAPGVVAEPVTAPGGDGAGAPAEPTPVIRIVRGNPTPEQVAALTLVLAASSGGGESADRLPRTLWTARARFARPRPAVGPGGWRASALPR